MPEKERLTAFREEEHGRSLPFPYPGLAKIPFNTIDPNTPSRVFFYIKKGQTRCLPLNPLKNQSSTALPMDSISEKVSGKSTLGK